MRLWKVVPLLENLSAKMLVKGEQNVSYICSRYYRAPELIFGASEYTTAIGCMQLVIADLWSAGCVIGELLLGSPVFPGESGVDQLVEIIKVITSLKSSDSGHSHQGANFHHEPKLRRIPVSSCEICALGKGYLFSNSRCSLQAPPLSFLIS